MVDGSPSGHQLSYHELLRSAGSRQDVLGRVRMRRHSDSAVGQVRPGRPYAAGRLRECLGGREAAASLAGLPTAGWFVVGVVLWNAVVVVVLNAGYSLFRRGSPGSRQGGGHGRERQ
jgi:hypothetical protein